MRLGIKEIQEIIPHRHPFLLIDFIDELEPGVRAVGYKSITFNEPQFNGHFPGQLGAVAILSLPENKGKTAFFGSINNAKFKQMVLPGDRLKLECEIIKRKGPIGVGKAVATNAEGKIAVSAELTFAIQ